jgi:hypothetical protein
MEARTAHTSVTESLTETSLTLDCYSFRCKARIGAVDPFFIVTKIDADATGYDELVNAAWGTLWGDGKKGPG